MAGLSAEAELEVVEFLEVFSYFRAGHTRWNNEDGTWLFAKWVASNKDIYDSLYGRSGLGMKMEFNTNFVCIDIDLEGKAKLFMRKLKDDRGDAGNQMAVDNQREMSDFELEFPGDKILALGEELGRRLEEHRAYVNEVEFPGTEALKEAVRILIERMGVEPTLLVLSPHGGAHAYWCFWEKQSWKHIGPRIEALAVELTGQYKKQKLNYKAEALPKPTKALRIPVIERIVDTKCLEVFPKGAGGIGFWKELKRYRIEELFPGESIGVGAAEAKVVGCSTEAEETKERPAKPRASSRGRGVSSLEQIEQSEMPFQNGKSNDQLMQIIRAGKREGLDTAQLEEWVVGWIIRSRSTGYTGDLGDDPKRLHDRIERLYSTCVVARASALLELWDKDPDRKKAWHDGDRLDRALARLDAVKPLSKRRFAGVRLFLGCILRMQVLVDKAATGPAGGLDEETRMNQKRGAYPFPDGLLRRMYGSYQAVWKAMATAGLVEKDESPDGRYHPEKGRPQFYRVRF
jgi:hypothetical protein